MKRAKYLIRIDDICEGLNVVNFYKIIDILNRYKIKPIIAVIPLNKDKNLVFPESIYGETFWKLIKNWKKSINGRLESMASNIIILKKTEDC